MKGYPTDAGFQPIHCLRGKAEDPVMMLVVVREQKTVTDSAGAFVSEAVVYKNTAGKYFGGGRWCLQGENGAIFRDHRSETVSGSADGKYIVREMREIAAWCVLPEESLRLSRGDRSGGNKELPVTA